MTSGWHTVVNVVAQLRFALSSANIWRLMDDDFNNNDFYNHIVDFFELPPTQGAAKEVDGILLWWNR